MNLTKILQLLDFNKIDREEVLRVAARRSFLKDAGSFSVKATLGALPFALSLMPKIVKAQNSFVVETLNFALLLEYLEFEFYRIGIEAKVMTSFDQTIFTQIKKHEEAHVNFLKTALGTSAIAKPAFDFTASGVYSSAFTSYSTFLFLAQTFEDTGVRAYKGQLGSLQSDNETLTAAFQIHSVEARHAAEIRRLRGKSIGQSIKGWIPGKESNGISAAVYEGEDNITHAGTSLNTFDSLAALSANTKAEAFDEPLTKAQVMAIIQPFLK